MAKKLWGGRFSKKTHPLTEEFTKSIDCDYKLAEYDVIGSIIHVDVLKKSGFLTAVEAEMFKEGLLSILGDIKSGKFKYDKRSEDIHTDIQNKLEKKIGGLVLKLHTARSRNDQVVFDLKLFSLAELSQTVCFCTQLINSLSKNSKDNQDLIIPGYTHLQHAQLVYLKDYLGSYIEMLTRDLERLEQVRKRIKLTLGAGALAGTPIDSEIYLQAIKSFFRENKNFCGQNCLAEAAEEISNSLDTVSDRDFVVEILSALSILGMHLSRLAEDLIIWSSKEFNFVEIDDAFSTGSSLMPQKKNADVMELIRGYTGALYGNLMNILTMLKGLPLAYNRDMQLDKPPLFSSFEIIKRELGVLAKLIEKLQWNQHVIAVRIEEDETLYATDMLYYLIEKGEPFKKAHDVIGELVSFSLKNNKKIKEMCDAELKKFSGGLKHEDIIKLMNPLISVKSRKSVKRKNL